MVLLLRFAGVLALALTVIPAAAQQAPPDQKPYKPVEVTIPAPSSDKSFEAFRKQLAGVVQRKDRAAFAKLVVATNFFWESDFGGMFDRKKSGFDNLMKALRLGDPDGRGWAALAAFATEPTTGPTIEHGHAQCAPAPPDYDDGELSTVTEATNTDVVDWSYPRVRGMQVRNAAAADGVVIDTLGSVLVRVLGTPDRNGWTKIATPSGKTGFVPPASLLSPLADRLCFARDASGWRITGYVGGGG
jgi:hypothetical protein